MGDLVNLQRPDGTVLQVTEEDAAQLRAYGYKDQDTDARDIANVEAAREDYYSSTSQKIKTGIEGLASGMTLGLSDKLLEATTEAGITGEEWRSRSEYNPGTRLGSELVGAIAPSFLSGGALTPAGALTKGAQVATKSIERAAVRGAARGALEGAGFGLGAEISHSALTGDPLTVEGSLAGMGWGAVWGGGLGALGGAIEGRLVKKAGVQVEAEQATKLIDDNYAAFRTSVREAATKADDAFKAVGQEIEVTAGRADAAIKEAGALRKGAFNEPWMEVDQVAKAEKKAAIDAYNDMEKAFAKKDWDAVEAASAKFEEQVAKLNKVAEGYPFAGPTDVGQFTRFTNSAGTKASQEAFKQIKDLGAVGPTLKTIAETPGGFANMSSGKFEKTAAALETFLKHPAAELAGSQEAIKATIARMAEQTGISVEGNAVAQLRGIWETAKSVKSAKGVEAAEKLTRGELPWARRVLVSGTGVAAARATGTGWAGYAMGRTIANGLLGVKGAVLGSISNAAAAWAPRAQKAVRYLAPQGQPLLIRLDGTTDLADKRKSTQELMLDRAREIREAAPRIRDTLYKQLQPINAHYPEYAAALHEQAVNQFIYLYNKLPRDPGNAFNRLESLYKPDALDTAKFGQTYEIFVNPAKVFQDFMQGRRVSASAAEDFSNLWPALFAHARYALIARFSDPAILNKMQYDDQVQMSLLTGIRMHSTMRPEFISQQQQMYTERSQPLPMAAQPGAPGSSGGRPSGESPYTTQAQRSTER